MAGLEAKMPGSGPYDFGVYCGHTRDPVPSVFYFISLQVSHWYGGEGPTGVDATGVWSLE